MKWLYCYKEIITMIVNVVMAGAAVAILITLWLQKQATQASMFSDIAGRLSSVLGETPEQEAKQNDQYNWIIRLLNELEALVFLGNQGLISKRMKEYYQEFIVGWIDDLPVDYPIASKMLKADQPEAFRELKAYYLALRGVEALLFSRD